MIKIVIAEGELFGCEADVCEDWIRVSLRNITVRSPYPLLNKKCKLILEVEDD